MKHWLEQIVRYIDVLCTGVWTVHGTAVIYCIGQWLCLLENFKLAKLQCLAYFLLTYFTSYKITLFTSNISGKLSEHLLTWFFWSALSLNNIHRTNLSFQSESGTEQLVDEDVAENKNQQLPGMWLVEKSNQLGVCTNLKNYPYIHLINFKIGMLCFLKIIVVFSTMYCWEDNISCHWHHTKENKCEKITQANWMKWLHQIVKVQLGLRFI